MNFSGEIEKLGMPSFLYVLQAQEASTILGYLSVIVVVKKFCSFGYSVTRHAWKMAELNQTSFER